jgi:hypothetical protein
MSDPGFTRSDLCSIRAAAEQDELAEAVRSGFSADRFPTGDDDPPALLPNGIDRAIRLSTAVAVLAIAGIAAYVSYWHAYAVVRAHGESGITARLEPATIDGLVYASSMVMLYAARHRVPVPSLARWLLGLGIAATFTANMAQGWSHGPVGAVVAAWPAVSLVGSYELLVWLICTSGAMEPRPSIEHSCNRAACGTAICSLPMSAVDGDRRGGSKRHASDPRRGPAGQAARLPAIPASKQRDDEVPGGSVNDAAVAAYRLSVQAGNPLSERRLAQMFGRTSRRWARARIADARQASSIQDSSDASAMAYLPYRASSTALAARSVATRVTRRRSCASSGRRRRAPPPGQARHASPGTGADSSGRRTGNPRQRAASSGGTSGRYGR